ncbi:MAG: alpha/beta fold hydrolase [Planctomycetota bacterium]|nr:alpha/beta fold hydrolase [Planctomycetota bacterium]
MNTRLATLIITLGAFLGFQARTVASQDEKKKGPPKVQKVVLKTKDSVNLVCDFFAGTKGKESMPVIMLHDHGGNRQQFSAFARYLQKYFGCAVVVPDLRGHGESTKTVTNRSIDFSKFQKSDFATFNNDIDACFRYLRDEVNNQGQANIDMLCVLATGYVGINALSWTVEDWSYPPDGGKKQGQFVKGVVLLSPRKSIKGISITGLLKEPLFSGRGMSPIPTLIAIGKGEEKSYRDGKSIHSTLSRTRPKYDKIADPEERAKKNSIWLGDYDKSHGAGLLNPDNKIKAGTLIARFLTYQIQEKSDGFPWVSYEKEE